MVSTTPGETEILWIVSKALHRAYGGINLTETGTANRDRGEPCGSSPSHTTVRTGPYTAVRWIKHWRSFAPTPEALVMEPPHRLRSLRATLSGLHPFPSPQRPAYWIFGRMAEPRSPRSSVLPTFGPSTKRAPSNMPSADSCAAIFDPYGSLSLQPETRRRSPEVRSTA